MNVFIKRTICCICINTRHTGRQHVNLHSYSMLYIPYLDLVSLLACCCPQAYVWGHHTEERCPKILNHSIRLYPATDLYAIGGILTTRRRTANPRCHDQPLRMLDRAHLYKYILGVCTQENSGTSLRQSHDHVQASF